MCPLEQLRVPRLHPAVPSRRPRSGLTGRTSNRRSGPGWVSGGGSAGGCSRSGTHPKGADTRDELPCSPSGFPPGSRRHSGRGRGRQPPRRLGAAVSAVPLEGTRRFLLKEAPLRRPPALAAAPYPPALPVSPRDSSRSRSGSSPQQRPCLLTKAAAATIRLDGGKKKPKQDNKQ